MYEVVLKAGRERALRRRHPWVLSGAVDRCVGAAPEPGAWVRVLSAAGEVLGCGHWSPNSQIRVRMLRFGKEEADDAWLLGLVRRAVERRAEDPLLGETDAVRLANAEGDGLPGLVVDRYGTAAVLRASSAGMYARRDALAATLAELPEIETVLDRPDAAAARREGFAARLATLVGAEPQEPVAIHEDARQYWVDLAGGQKTGFYLDQRDARRLVARLAPGRRALDLFAYTGGFAVAAATAGAAQVTLVESSEPALALAERNLAAAPGRCPRELVRGDAFQFIRRSGAEYDLIAIDPPPLARRAGDVGRASRAYKDVLMHALRRAAPAAWILTFSCSHHVGPELFRKIAFGASLDAGRTLQVVGELGAPSDHPVSLDHPEGRYLTGLILRL